MESYNQGPRASTPIIRPSFAYADGWQDRVPPELRDRDHWVLWRYERVKDKWTKMPYQAHAPGRKASTTDPQTWNSFADTVEAFLKAEGTAYAADGVGYVFSSGDPFAGFDLDNSLGEDGEVLEWARPYLNRLTPTYTEVSPSGRGLKGVALGQLPGHGLRRTGLGSDGTGAVELYDNARFFTITGDPYEGLGLIRDRSEEITGLYAELSPHRGNGHAEPSGEPAGDDDSLLDLARKARNGAEFIALYDQGIIPARCSHSEADFRLCCRLAFWFNRDAGAIDRVFRLSALMRDKWDERRSSSTYGGYTISNAIAATEEVYTPRSREREEATADPSGNGHASGLDAILGDTSGSSDLPQGMTFRLTDMGNGERIVHRFGKDIRYVAPWKKWLVWDGARWAIDQGGSVARLAKKAVRLIYVEAACNPDLEHRKATANWAKASESNSRIEAMIKQASSEESIEVRPRELDRNPWLLNCPNGVIDLRSGELREHRREDLITQVCPVAFDPSAECPLWESTLDLVFGGNTSLIRYWQMLCGLILTGTVSEQVLPIAHGSGENGKSTLVNALQEMLGPDYAMKAPPNFLMVKRHESHPTELADLFGKRLVVAIETGEGARINEVLIKELTGSDPIRARRMREDFWQFNPTHKVVLCTNHRPSVRGTDHAIWRRIHLVPFGVKIPADRKDKAMPSRLAGELSGILAWCVRGCLEWREAGGLEPPEEVTDATAGYRAEQDVITRFLEESCKALPSVDSVKVKASTLYAAYRAWAERAGESPITQKMFGDRMTEKGFERKTSNGIWYLGIGLLADSGDF